MATKTYVDNLEFNSRGLKDIEVSFENGFYKYLYGLTSDYNTSLVFLEEAKSKGYPEAFLIAFTQFPVCSFPLNSIFHSEIYLHRS